MKGEIGDQPWMEDPEYKNLTPHQQYYVTMVLRKVRVFYFAGRQSGRTTMKNFVQKWLDKMEMES